MFKIKSTKVFSLFPIALLLWLVLNHLFSYKLERIKPLLLSKYDFQHGKQFLRQELLENEYIRLDLWLNTPRPNEVGAMRKKLYKYLLAPFQFECSSLKRVGGRFMAGGYDGQKFVCLDLLPSIGEKRCLVYSFGIGGDADFETALMNHLGCEIHAYDHSMSERTRKRLEQPEKGFYIHNKRMGAIVGEDVTTFKHELSVNGHELSDIFYLKVDIEGDERDLLKEWMNQGLLDRVKQLQFEFHFLQDDDHMIQYYDLVQDITTLGFVPIAFDANFHPDCGMSKDGFINCFEVAFKKRKRENRIKTLR